MQQSRKLFLLISFVLSFWFLFTLGCARKPALIPKGTMPDEQRGAAVEKTSPRLVPIPSPLTKEPVAPEPLKPAATLPDVKPEPKVEPKVPELKEATVRAEPAKTLVAPMEKKEDAPAAPLLKEEPVKDKIPTAKVDRVTLADINFDYDKYTLKPEAREILRQHAQWLLKQTDYTLIIEGHCDERGSHEYNLALGERRALEAMKYLVALGVAENNIQTISYGKELPLDPRSNEEAWAKNRRAHFIVKFK